MVVAETRSVQSRLDLQDEQIKILQSDIQEIKSTLKGLEADREESAEFRKLMLGWLKLQGKQPLSDSRGDTTRSSFILVNDDEEESEGDRQPPPPANMDGEGEGKGGPQPKANSDGIPWATKKITLPEFYGFDPQGWIHKATLYFDINGTPPNLRIRLAQLSMVGVAQHWFTIVKQVHDSLTWDQFKIELLQRFSGLEIQNPFEQLATITQSDSIHDYIDDFEYVLSLVPRLPESQSIGYFVAGLREDVKKWVRIHRPQTRLDAMYLAKDIEEMLRPSGNTIVQSRFRYHFSDGIPDGVKGDRYSQGHPGLFRNHLMGKPPESHSHFTSESTRLSVPAPSRNLQSGSSSNSSYERGVRSLSRTEWEERRKKGLCFRCGQQFGPAHKCPEGKLRVLLLADDECDETGGALRSTGGSDQPIVDATARMEHGSFVYELKS